MDSYAIYRLEDWSWVEFYQQRMGEEAFREYRDSVYRKLLSLQPGNLFNIEEKVKVENRDLFIKICCAFIQEGHPEYVFSEDYKKIRCYENKTKMV